MSEQNVLNTLTFNFSFQALDGEVIDTSPIYRLIIDISYGYSVGALQCGLYVKVNDSVYFVAKQCINVVTVDEAEKVFAFLNKTQAPFTISVRRDKTNSGYQYVQAKDIEDARLYELREYKVYKGLWQTLEGVLYENKWYTILSRWIGGRLIWYINLQPMYPLKFKQNPTISAEFFNSQGHLDIFKITIGDRLNFPSKLYSMRRKLTFYNHTIEGDLAVIPLGSQMRIVNIFEETNITSPDHLSITLPVGEYLLVHPIPRDDVD